MAENTQDCYFIILDKAPVKGETLAWYQCYFGNAYAALGTLQCQGRTIRGLLEQIPAGEAVYRVFLKRTDGKTGKKLLRKAV